MAGGGSSRLLRWLSPLALFLSVSVIPLSGASPAQDTQGYYPVNPRLFKAFLLLQYWKHHISDDPKNITATWYGPHVCSYAGVFCAPAPDDPHVATVAGIDFNHFDLEGTIPGELGGLLSDLALLHLNSNRFSGTLPESLREMNLLHELDVSNNRLAGAFPGVVLCIPSLRYVDLRFNRFHGAVPAKLYDLASFDAIFLNNNNFTSSLPGNIGKSPASVIVLANNPIGGCLPRSLGNMTHTLREIIILNSGMRSCIPPELGELKNLKVLDLGRNKLAGPLPETLGQLKKLQQLNVGHNHLSGGIPAAICELPRLKNFTYSYNYFCGEPERCLKIRRRDDRKNCIPFRPLQRPEEQCAAALSKPVRCSDYGCIPPPPPPPPPHTSSPPPPSPPPPPPYYH